MIKDDHGSYLPPRMGIGAARVVAARHGWRNLIAADYLPTVSQAQKSGTIAPEPPPLYAKFIASEAACRR